MGDVKRTMYGAYVEAADPTFEQSWWHEAHGLHDEAHHQAHDPLHVCVPVVMGKLSEHEEKLRNAVIQTARNVLDSPSDDWWFELDGAIHALDGTPPCNERGVHG